MLKFLLSSCLLFANIAFANSVFIEIFDSKGDDKTVGIITANGQTIIPMQYQQIIQNDDDIDGNKEQKWVGIYQKDDKEYTDYYTLDGQFLKSQASTIPYSEYELPNLMLDYPDFNDKEKLVKVHSEIEQKINQLSKEDREYSYKSEVIINSYLSLINRKTDKQTPLTDKKIAKLSRFQNIGERELGVIGAMDENGKWGFIDDNANWVIPPQFDDLNDDSRPFVKPLPSHILSIYQFYKKIDDNYKRCWGFVFKDGSTAGEFDFFKGFEKHSKYGNIGFAQPCNAYLSKHNGIINDKGEWLIMPQKGRRLLSFPDEQDFIAIQNVAIDEQYNDENIDKIGFMDMSENIKIPVKFYFPNSREMNFDSNNAQAIFTNELMAVSEKKNSPYYGFIDRKGNWVIEPNLITNNSNSYAFDNHGFSYTYLPNNEHQAKEYEIAKSQFFLSDFLFPNSISGRRVIDKTGKELFKDLAGDFYNFNDKGYAVFVSHKNKNLQGVIDKNGHFIIPPQYDNLDLADNVVIATLEKSNQDEINQVGLLDYKGNVILPFEYQSIADYTFMLDDNAVLVVQHHNGKYGILDKFGNWLLPLQDKNLRIFDEGIWFKTIGFN